MRYPVVYSTNLTCIPTDYFLISEKKSLFEVFPFFVYADKKISILCKKEMNATIIRTLSVYIKNDEKKRKQDEIERLEAEEARNRAKKLEEWVMNYFIV